MRSKANKFIGGLHNSAAIPGVIVFPLSLSCGDESLMRSCLVIMDGMDRLPPCPAAGAGSRWRNERGRARGRVYMYGVWTGSVKDSVRDGQRREQAAGICVAACVHAVCHVCKDLSQCLAVLNFHE